MTTNQAQFKEPPRVTGEAADDLRQVINWLWGFFNSAIREGGLIQNTEFAEQLAAQYPSLFNLGELTLAANKMIYATSTSEWATSTLSAFMRTLLDDADGAAAQATLGISAVISDAELLALAGLTSAADKLPYFTGSGTAALADFTSFSRTLVALANSTLWRTNLGLAIGSDVQAYDAELAALAGLTSAADKLPYFTGSGTAAVTAFTSFGRSLVDDADAATARTTLGLPDGVYTPTLTNVLNLDATTAYECQYLEVGNTVNVSGRFDADPTAAGAVSVGISLPLASNFGATEDCAGVAFSPSVAGLGAAIGADAANDRAQAQWIAVDTANRAFYFNFTYQRI